MRPVSVGEVVRQVTLYREHLKADRWIVATAFPVTSPDLAELTAAKITHVRLGGGFERWAAAQECLPADLSPDRAIAVGRGSRALRSTDEWAAISWTSAMPADARDASRCSSHSRRRRNRCARPRCGADAPGQDINFQGLMSAPSGSSHC